MRLINDYYVHESFIAENPFWIVEGMLYEKFSSIKLEPKGRLNKDTLRIYPDHHGLWEENISSDYPLVSDNKYLLFIGENVEKPNSFEALLIPAYNNPLCP